MESFVDADSHKPVSKIEIAEGETKIVGLKKFSLGSPPSVVVQAQNIEVAFCFQSCHLKDMKKHTYNDVYDISYFSDETVPVEKNNLFFFQICGLAAGQTTITAPFMNAGTNADPYADPVPITVKENKKRLMLVPEKGSPAITFDTLWTNHPLNPANGPVDYPCNEGKAPLYHMQCMVRFCTALEASGVSFAGFVGSKCDLPGAEHVHHFSNPYDFESWSIARRTCYVWEAKPLQPEPMPGLAAFWYVLKRQGIILFWNYFDPKELRPCGVAI